MCCFDKECYCASDSCLHVAWICSNKLTKDFCYLKIRNLMCIWVAHRLHDSPHPPEWAHHGVVAAPVTTGPVLSGAQEILASPVVGVLIEDPETFHDVAGVNVTVAEAFIYIRAVIHELHGVSHHVRPVVDPHLVGSSILYVKEVRTWLLCCFGRCEPQRALW